VVTECDRAAGWLEQHHDLLHQGGFPCTVRSEQAVDLLGPYLKTDPIIGDVVALRVHLDQALEPEFPSAVCYHRRDGVIQKCHFRIQSMRDRLPVVSRHQRPQALSAGTRSNS